jgi:hypothetical protein
LKECRAGAEKPPGLGIPSLALLDGLMLYTTGMMGLSLLVPGRIQGRAQGGLTLAVALLTLAGAVVTIIAAIAALVLMLTMLLAVPFGTIAYLIIFGTFAAGRARVVLSLVMTCKLAFAGCLVFAHQRFLQNWGLVVFILVSLLATVLVSCLHGFVPPFLVSITDAVAALIVAILALVWASLLLIGSIIAVVKAVR